MKRNLENYAKQGEKHANNRYSLYFSELEPLMIRALSSPDGAFSAISTAFYAGFEAGL